jgi:hypothetical protein
MLKFVNITERLVQIENLQCNLLGEILATLRLTRNVAELDKTETGRAFNEISKTWDLKWKGIQAKRESLNREMGGV